jgi:NADPH-dependent glutamate synthase beta subunit-like oxidoreductase
MISDINIKINRDLCFSCCACVERCIMDNLRMYLAPCRAACPIHMNCQGYVHLLARGKDEVAAKEMRRGLPFAGILGRVCTQPCEEKCERRRVDDGAVHIRGVKRYLADAYPEIAFEPTLALKATGKRVAIVGSGPAGLMAAHELAVQGHRVTVFEAAAEPGGMLRWGIPAFRLPAREVTRAVELLEKMKVDFQCGQKLGKDFDVEKLEREWDAVLVATGGGSSATLGIPGEDLPGVHHGLDFLRQAREGSPPRIGQSVIVIGGGNTAVDVALTCRRLGAADVSLICLEEGGRMPAFPVEIKEALEEGITIMDCWGPRRILRGGDRGFQIELSRCLKLYDDSGRFCPQLDDACGLAPSAETVVVAIGQQPDLAVLPADMHLSAPSRMRVDSLTLQTARSKVFAAGDLVSGPRSVVAAMAQGREAALSIGRFLSGEGLKWGRAYGEGACITDFPIDTSGALIRPRGGLPRLPLPLRKLDTEVEKTLNRQTARAEAERCLNCGRPAEVNKTCWYCLPCEIECPVQALEVRMPYQVR